MPIRKRVRRARRRFNKGGMKGRRSGLSAGPSLAPSGRGQYASIVETIDEGASSLPNIVQFNTFSLGQFDRAKALAPQFQYYRAKKVTYTYTPLYNTYQQGSPALKPYLYLHMNRTQLPYGGGLPQLQHSGARPKPFTSVVKLSYTPNWCSPGTVAVNPVAAPGLTDISNIGLQKQYAWLACPVIDTGTGASGDLTNTTIQNTSIYLQANATTNNVTYNGHVSCVDQPGNISPVYNLLIQVHWEFKGAHFFPTSRPSLSVPE